MTEKFFTTPHLATTRPEDVVSAESSQAFEMYQLPKLTVVKELGKSAMFESETDAHQKANVAEAKRQSEGQNDVISIERAPTFQSKQEETRALERKVRHDALLQLGADLRERDAKSEKKKKLDRAQGLGIHVVSEYEK